MPAVPVGISAGAARTTIVDHVLVVVFNRVGAFEEFLLESVICVGATAVRNAVELDNESPEVLLPPLGKLLVPGDTLFQKPAATLSTPSPGVGRASPEQQPLPVVEVNVTNPFELM